MKKEEVLELIQRNGAGADLRCFFLSENKKENKDHMSKINNYKYTYGVIKIYMERYDFEKHQEILTKSSLCKILIKKDEAAKRQTVTKSITLFCKFIEIIKQDIYVRIFSIEYDDENGNKKTLTVQPTKHK